MPLFQNDAALGGGQLATADDRGRGRGRGGQSGGGNPGGGAVGGDFGFDAFYQGGMGGGGFDGGAEGGYGNGQSNYSGVPFGGGYNDSFNSNMMAMHRNSLLGNAGGGFGMNMMGHRGSMGFGYNGNYGGYYRDGGFGNYNQGNFIYGNQGGGNANTNMNMNMNANNQGGGINNVANNNPSNTKNSKGNSNMPSDNAEELPLEEEEDPDNPSIDYLAARAHAAQMLAAEESKRLEENLMRLEMRRRMQAMNSGPSGGNSGNTGNGIQGLDGASGRLAGFGNQESAMPQQGGAQGNRGRGQSIGQEQMQGGNQDYYNQGNNTVSTNTNMRNTNGQSKDDHLFERSRWNNNQMNMRNFNNNVQNMMDNGMNMGYNPQYGGYTMMPPMNAMMMGDFSQGMPGMGGMPNNMMIPVNGGMNNTSTASPSLDKKKKKGSKRSTITDPMSLPVIPPPQPKKEIAAPRRPLSAYNIFFSEMREVILKEEEMDHDSKENDKDKANGDQVNEEDGAQDKKVTQDENENDPQAKQEESATASASSLAPEKDMKDFTQALMKKRLSTAPSKRVHRKTHGKVAFTTLAQTVGRRWKELPEEAKKRYKDLAELDRERYKKEKTAMQKALREEAKRLRKEARRVHTGSVMQDVEDGANIPTDGQL
ncbi:hypothetical protein HJC23_012454 [Cyclotella cryptica]|uniref:HMG box domain-containing protein n=1 Tax=Cyclotella cryptica TaxID=29204 RepID=A0ABD3P5D2_9STRA|eukprot:CCRYP_017459-RA/>CCRYP_017459-RA protein AED:0.09 eAED:0.09 QI:0/-1/0/1/-1/1/1/0/649